MKVNTMQIRRTSLLLPLLLAVLLAACTDGDGPRMRQQLKELEDMNQADSVMTNDTLAERLVKYFDRHGTPNERMRAHYILGRTFADMGDYPSAVEAYMDAVEAVDTTHSYCEFSTLCRVYGQMSDVFYQQSLLDDCLFNLQCAAHYAWKAMDTSYALNATAHIIPVLFRLGQEEKAMSLFDEVYNKIATIKGIEEASRYCILPVEYLLENKDYHKAKEFLNLYEAHSGYFDSLGNIAKGREVFYYYKGMYYLHTFHYDSAEILFRKEMLEAADPNNQNAAARGLAFLFRATHQLDSAIEYSFYSYAMNDSSYNHATMEEVEKAKSLYNYRHHQKEVQKEKTIAKKKKAEIRLLYILLFTVILIAGCLMARWQKKKHDIEEQINKKRNEYEEARQQLQDLVKQKNDIVLLLRKRESVIAQDKIEIQELRKHESEFNSWIVEKERVIGQQSDELSIMHSQEEVLRKLLKEKQETIRQRDAEFDTYKHKMTLYEIQIREKESEINNLQSQIQLFNHEKTLKEDIADSQFSEYAIYRKLHDKNALCHILSDLEWEKIEQMMAIVVPDYYRRITSSAHTLSNTEYRLCHLLRLHIGMKAAGDFIGVSKTHVSRISSEIMQKLFNETGGGKKLQKRLETLF